MIVRGGIPKPLVGTAPQVPGAPLANASALAPFQILAECKTVWVRIENTGANALRLFFKNPGLDPALWLEYYEIPAAGVIEGYFELTDVWAAGVGGTTTYKALLGLRVI